MGLCLLSAALAMIDWHFGGRPWLVLGLLAGVWSFTADWLGGRLWLLHKRFGEIYEATRVTGRGGFWLPPLAKTISRGALILSVVSVATCSFGP